MLNMQYALCTPWVGANEQMKQCEGSTAVIGCESNFGHIDACTFFALLRSDAYMAVIDIAWNVDQIVACTIRVELLTSVAYTAFIESICDHIGATFRVTLVALVANAVIGCKPSFDHSVASTFSVVLLGSLPRNRFCPYARRALFEASLILQSAAKIASCWMLLRVRSLPYALSSPRFPNDSSCRFALLYI